jgi:hypothetical protein
MARKGQSRRFLAFREPPSCSIIGSVKNTALFPITVAKPRYRKVACPVMRGQSSGLGCCRPVRQRIRLASLRYVEPLRLDHERRTDWLGCLSSLRQSARPRARKMRP